MTLALVARHGRYGAAVEPAAKLLSLINGYRVSQAITWPLGYACRTISPAAR
jgi:hypothetical protein